MTDQTKATAKTGERIAKRLSRAGVCSRRDAEKLVAEGRVRVNGKVLETPVTLVTDSDRIEVDGKRLPGIDAPRLWLYHKPKGLVTTHRDEEGRPTIFEALPPDMPRVISVGRLDLNSEGLLLLTNDGGLSRLMELPATGLPRQYRVRVFGRITQGKLDTLKDGVTVDGVKYGAIKAAIEGGGSGKNTWLNVTLKEGKNREIRRVMNHIGLDVNSFDPHGLWRFFTG